MITFFEVFIGIALFFVAALIGESLYDLYKAIQEKLAAEPPEEEENPNTTLLKAIQEKTAVALNFLEQEEYDRAIATLYGVENGLNIIINAKEKE